MSYSIDLFRGRARPARSFVDFYAYVSLFPQLVAGPIVRYHEISEELRERMTTWSMAAEGCGYFVIGFAKKIWLANSMGMVADLAFSADAPTAAVAWAGVLAYALQIYFDFSGYSDMAIGLGRILGFHFPQNFLAPYRAASITEFWRRWHVSLSRWLRDYLYVPLGGNRRGRRRTYVNLFLTMLLGGLWHGAAWSFVVWGAVHGVLLAIERVMGWRDRRGLGNQLLTLFLILHTWVLFRATSLGHAGDYFAAMWGANGWASTALVWVQISSPWLLAMLTLGWVLVALAPRSDEIVEASGRAHREWLYWLVPALFVVSLFEMWNQSVNPFLYFQF